LKDASSEGMEADQLLQHWSHNKFVRKNTILALGGCFPQLCSSAGHTFPADRSRFHYYQPIGSYQPIGTTNQLLHFHNNKSDEMPCKLDPTENLRSYEKYPTQGGVEYFSNKRRLRNPAYIAKAFHQVRLCGNELIGWQYFKSDLDTANLRSALEHGCGKRTTRTCI